MELFPGKAIFSLKKTTLEQIFPDITQEALSVLANQTDLTPNTEMFTLNPEHLKK